MDVQDERQTVMMLFKAHVISRLKQCYVLTSPLRAGRIVAVRNVQRAFAVCIYSQKSDLRRTTENAHTVLFGVQTEEIYHHLYMENPGKHGCQSALRNIPYCIEDLENYLRCHKKVP